MAGFVVSNQLLLLIGHDSILFLEANGDAFQSIEDIVRVNLGFVRSGCLDGTFVQEIRKVGTRHSRCLPSYRRKVNTRCQVFVLGMDFENLGAALHVRRIHLDLTIETSRSHQSLVQDVSPVRCCNDNYPLVALEAVHLCQQLIHRLLTLIVALAEASAPLAAHCIDFINEDDAWCRLLGLFEEVTHAGRTNARKDLNEFRG
mmetsp:Transcript_80783/g.193755  ORF Transcript_80783/g.193755 Transcript_80783/m.193755 type:complete len:202 (-) Transcript_80783:1270-1875(-)